MKNLESVYYQLNSPYYPIFSSFFSLLLDRFISKTPHHSKSYLNSSLTNDTIVIFFETSTTPVKISAFPAIQLNYYSGTKFPPIKSLLSPFQKSFFFLHSSYSDEDSSFTCIYLYK